MQEEARKELEGQPFAHSKKYFVDWLTHGTSLMLLFEQSSHSSVTLLPSQPNELCTYLPEYPNNRVYGRAGVRACGCV